MKDSVAKEVELKKLKLYRKATNTIKETVSHLRKLMVHKQDIGVQVSGHRCEQCGITFDDDILSTLHRCWLSHGDPFLCNMCGKGCENKYEFYSHLVNGDGK